MAISGADTLRKLLGVMCDADCSPTEIDKGGNGWLHYASFSALPAVSFRNISKKI